jgi:hypothetical protein
MGLMDAKPDRDNGETCNRVMAIRAVPLPTRRPTVPARPVPFVAANSWTIHSPQLVKRPSSDIATITMNRINKAVWNFWILSWEAIVCMIPSRTGNDKPLSKALPKDAMARALFIPLPPAMPINRATIPMSKRIRIPAFSYPWEPSARIGRMRPTLLPVPPSFSVAPEETLKMPRIKSRPALAIVVKRLDRVRPFRVPSSVESLP